MVLGRCLHMVWNHDGGDDNNNNSKDSLLNGIRVENNRQKAVFHFLRRSLSSGMLRCVVY